MGYKETELGILPHHWEISTMENALESIIDYRGKTPEKSDDGILTLSAKSVKNGYIDYSSAYCISPETYKKFMVRGMPQIGDILMTTEAPLGCIAKLDRDDVGIAQRLLTLRGKKGYLSNDYLMYYLSSYIGQHQLQARASGTTVTGIKQSEFRKVLISIPPIAEQHAITDTLLCIDRKIENNNKTNETLEKMVQTIFESWFINFEPFQEMGTENSDIGIIPKGWVVRELGEIIEIINGYSYKGTDLKESVNAMLTIKNFDRNGGLKIDGFKEIEISDRVKERHYINLFDVLVACTDLTQNAEIIGNPIIVLTKSNYRKLIASMDLVKVIPKEQSISNFYLYTLMKDERFKQFSLGYTSGTTVLHLNKKAISEYKIAFPNELNILDRFTDIVEPMFKEISKNINENMVLSSLRDSLLPKLISGELRVPQKEV